MGGTGCLDSRRKELRFLAVLLSASAMALSPGHAVSGDDVHVGPVIRFVNSNVRGWLSDPLIIAALKARNRANLAIDQRDIDALDATWRTEIEAPFHPMIDKALGTPLSHFLKQKEEEALGSITEIFVMDAKGLNVGQSSVTSDYWQGDEDKFRKTFMAGPGAVFVDAANKDESTQMLQSQVSLTIVDESNRPIGAITIGVNLDQL